MHAGWVHDLFSLYNVEKIWPGRTDQIQDDPKFAVELAAVTSAVRSLYTSYTCPFDHFVVLCCQVSESRMSRAKLGAMVKEMRKYDPQFSSTDQYCH